MGLTYNNGLIFAATAYDATVIAINATNGKIIWQSQPLGSSKAGYNLPSQPIAWKDYVIVGSAGGAGPLNGVGTVQGNVTALNSIMVQ